MAYPLPSTFQFSISQNSACEKSISGALWMLKLFPKTVLCSGWFLKTLCSWSLKNKSLGAKRVRGETSSGAALALAD
jgi:hypothetical protein